MSNVYASDPSASLLNFDSKTMKFSNPLAVFYTDDPSSKLIERIVQSSGTLTSAQVPEFISLAATLLKAYKNRQTNTDADAVSKTKQ
jgi:hypothetical protein